MRDTEPLDILEYVLKNVPREDAVNALTTFFLNRLMEEEACMQAGAGRYERSDGRKAHRNGYKERRLMTQNGPVVLSKPQLREVPFETCVFDKYDRVEKAVALAIAESYVQGVSTRRIRLIMDELGITNVSASTVSRICGELDEKVDEFLGRRIDTSCWCLLVDASYFKVCEDSKYVSKALLIVIGVRDDGLREVLGARIADSEDQLFWEDLFMSLQDRGLHGVEFVVSDGHRGIQGAVQTCFQGASWQMCHVHLHRAVLRKTPLKHHKEVSTKLSEALKDPEALDAFTFRLKEMGLGRASETIERFRYDLFNYQAYPQGIWEKIRTTNLPERLNRELKRRTKVVGAFPGKASFMRLAGSLLININRELLTGYKYIDIKKHLINEDSQG
jgi:transposase-like protein